MPKTKRFGLIGRDIDYSFSKDFFSTKFKKENLESYEYVNCDINKVEDFNKIKIKDFSGFNVTIPYKEKIPLKGKRWSERLKQIEINGVLFKDLTKKQYNVLKNLVKPT